MDSSWTSTSLSGPSELCYTGEAVILYSLQYKIKVHSQDTHERHMLPEGVEKSITVISQSMPSSNSRNVGLPSVRDSMA